LRKVLGWLSAVFVLLATLAFCLYLDFTLLLSEDSLRGWVERLLSATLDATVGFERISVSLRKRCLTVEKVSLTRKGGNLSAKIGTLVGYFDIEGRSLSSVRAEDVVVGLRLGEDWSLPLDGLLKLRMEDGGRDFRIPEVAVHNLRLSLVLPEGRRMRQVEAHSSEVTVTPEESGGFRVGIYVPNSSFGRIDGFALFGRDGRPLSFHLTAQGVDIRRLLEFLPSEVAESLEEFKISGKAEVTLSGEYDGRDGWVHKISLYVPDGSLDVPVVRTEAQKLRLYARGAYKAGKLKVDFSAHSRLGVGGDVLLSGEIRHGEKGVEVVLNADALGVPSSRRLYLALPEDLQSVFDILSPTGRLDVSVALRYREDDGESEPDVTVKVRPRDDASVAVEWFPYRIGDIDGEVVYHHRSETVRFRALSRWKGMNLLAKGTYEDKNGVLRVSVRASDILVDDDIMFAIPVDVREVLGELGLEGSADVNIEVLSDGDGTDFTVSIFPSKKMSLTPISFPVSVTEVEGVVRIGEDGVRLEGVRGRLNGGRVIVGDVLVPFEWERDVLIGVKLKDVPLDERIMGVVCDSFGLERKEWEAKGLLNGVIQFVVTEDELRQFGYLHLDGLRFRYADYPEITDGEGVLNISPSGLRIEWVHGRTAGGRASVWGEISDDGDETGIRLRIDAYDIPLDNTLRMMLPGWLREYWDYFSPSGQADFHCSLDGAVETPRCSVRLVLKGVVATPIWFPYEVKGINGSVGFSIDDERVVISDMSAEDGAVAVEGVSIPIGEQRRLTTLTVRLDGLPYGYGLADALPVEVSSVLESLAFNSRISGTVLVRVNETEEHTETELDASLDLSETTLNAGVRIEDVDGSVHFSVLLSDDELVHLSLLRFAFKDFKVEGIEIAELLTALSVSEEKVSAEKIEGKIYGGSLSGECEIKENGTTEVYFSVRVKDAEVRKAAESLFGKKMENVTGKVSLSADLSIVSEEERTRLRGSGRIHMENANLWEVPFFSLLVKALSLGAIKVPFSEAGCKFSIEDDLVKFRDVYFRSPIVSLEGKGKLWFGGKMRFRFAIRFLPTFLKYIPVFSWIWDFIRNNIVQIKVKGTAKRPVIMVAPFQPIADFLKGED